MRYAEFAASVGVPVGTVKRWVHEGMPVVRMGARVEVDVAAAHRWMVPRRLHSQWREGVVYFARGDHGLIKIGFSSDTDRRMREIGSDLLATVPGSIPLEFALHEAFAADRAHDEWFHPSASLLGLIELLAAGAQEKAA